MSSFIIPLSSLPSLSSIGEGGVGKSQALGAGNIPFADFLQNAVQNMETSKAASQQSTVDLALGASDDLHSGAIDALKYSTAVSFASGVTSSVIRAYNELLRMQL